MKELRSNMWKAATVMLLLATSTVAHSQLNNLQDLQPGHWARISQNTINDVNPCPSNNCSYTSIEGVSAVVDDWNGGAFASGIGQLGGLIAFGGGHRGYYGNEVYVFELDSRRWVRYSDPVANPNCNYSTGELQDGSPCSIHTYDYVDYHPASNSFVVLGATSMHDQGGMGVGVPHMFDLDSRTWRRGTRQSFGDGLFTGASSAYDPNRDAFWVIMAYNNFVSKFDPKPNGGAGEWTSYSRFNVDIDTASAIDPTRDLLVSVDGLNQRQVVVHDLSNPSAAPSWVTTSGDKTMQNRTQIGFEWDPVTESFVAWHGGSSVYSLKPPAGDWRTGTWVWTRHDPAPSNTVTPSAPNTNGTYSRWRYVPALNAFIVVNRTNDDVYLYKLSDGGGSAPANPTASLTASPLTVDNGGSAQLSWSSNNTNSCTASGGWAGNKAVSGSENSGNLSNQGSSSTTVDFRLDCAGDNGTASSTVTITVLPDSGGGGGGDQTASWNERSTHPDVVKAVGFDSQAEFNSGQFPDGRAAFNSWDSNQMASGNGSLRFDIPSQSPANSSGQWRTNFSNDPINNSVTFGENEQFWIQWRQKFDRYYVEHNYRMAQGWGAWKQVVIGQGDGVSNQEGYDPSTGYEVGSCTELELVVHNNSYQGYPSMYHSCGWYYPLETNQGGSPARHNQLPGCSINNPGACMEYVADQWMTFQVGVQLGPWQSGAVDSNTGERMAGFANSSVELWVGYEGQPSQLVHRQTGLVLRRGNYNNDWRDGAFDAEYGKIWLTPYNTGKDSGEVHQDASTWYDELIISRSKIADPVGGSGGTTARPEPPANLVAE